MLFLKDALGLVYQCGLQSNGQSGGRLRWQLETERLTSAELLLLPKLFGFSGGKEATL